MSESLPLLDRVLVGRYRIVRLIARGGMAEVWEGYDDVLARPVAVKVLHPHLAADELFVERFRREAIAAARLGHPSIVATFDTGTDGDVTFIVMELVRGKTLRDALRESGTLPPATAVALAAEVADALEHAHQAGLVHRDVKPANILLSEHPGETAPLLRVKVADFGIAKLQVPDTAGAALTQTGAVVGTARYLSPEQVQGGSPDARSDVYALGVVLYEMLCGRPPFQAETELATAVLHVREAPPPLAGGADRIPTALEEVVLQALAKDPAHRFQSAAALRTALLSVDVAGGRPDGPDDAVPLVVRDPTPPSGMPTVPRRPARRFAPLAVVAGLVLVAAGVVAVLAGDDSGGRAGTGDDEAGGGVAVDIAAVRSFDPQGRDGEENEPRARLATDGDPATSWSTDRYNTRAFGGLKPGVGLVLELSESADLGRLQVRSATSDWSASVFVADEPSAQLSGWGEPVATRAGIAGDAAFDLEGRNGSAVLLWITDPGPSRQAAVAEITLSTS